VEVINAPGRFDRSPATVAHDIAHWTGLAGVSVVFVTEVAAKARAAALEVDGWTLHHEAGAGDGECAILTKDATREVVKSLTVTLDEGGGKARFAHPLVAPVVICDGKSGRRTLYTNAHLRAHLEGIWAKLPMPARSKVKRLRKSGKPIIRQWIADVDAWRLEVHRLAAKYKVDDIIVAADWNLNGDRAWVQALMRELWPGLSMVRTKGPDLGRRNIGWLLTNMRLTDSEVLHAQSSDHRAGHFTLKHVNSKPARHPDPRPVPPPPFEHCTYNGALMDQKTKTFVQCCEKDLGYSLTILQGCYHPGVSQSAGTHDGGGVVDLAPFDWSRKTTVARKRGGFYWHRLPIPGVWGEHIHGGIRNHGTLSPSAARQQDDFDAHPPRNGLANHAVDTSGLHPDPPATFSYLGAWHEINA
jgi:hypothetical protein